MVAKQAAQQPDLLTTPDLLRSEHAHAVNNRYPGALAQGHLSLRLSYRFELGTH